MFANAGRAAGAQVNRALGMLQDISCGRDLKRFLIVSVTHSLNMNMSLHF
jgi:hypothetical protein